jgi:hypothetical protein
VDHIKLIRESHQAPPPTHSCFKKQTGGASCHGCGNSPGGRKITESCVHSCYSTRHVSYVNCNVFVLRTINQGWLRASPTRALFITPRGDSSWQLYICTLLYNHTINCASSTRDSLTLHVFYTLCRYM